MEKPDAKAMVALSLHTADSFAGVDLHYLVPGNAYRFLEKDHALIRGGCFELGRRFYRRKFGGLEVSEATGEQVLSRFKSDANAENVRFLNEWLAWRRSHRNGLDLTDNFYLDQRLGGWLSALEQSLDVLAGNSIQPVNCERFLSSLIAPMSREERSTGALQREVIRHLDSKLLKIPINPISFAQKLKKMAMTSMTRRTTLP
jgi:hypothetical protein